MTMCHNHPHPPFYAFLKCYQGLNEQIHIRLCVGFTICWQNCEFCNLCNGLFFTLKHESDHAICTGNHIHAPHQHENQLGLKHTHMSRDILCQKCVSKAKAFHRARPKFCSFILYHQQKNNQGSRHSYTESNHLIYQPRLSEKLLPLAALNSFSTKGQIKSEHEIAHFVSLQALHRLCNILVCFYIQPPPTLL